MDAFGALLGYNGRYGSDEFPIPGELIRHTRLKLRLTQEELASLLGCDRTMVAKMEKNNHGLDSVIKRRQVAGALGILPAALGLLTPDNIGKQVLYDTSLLKKTLHLHQEVYFNGGEAGGTKEIDDITSTIHAISKDINHKNQDVLRTLCHYYQLGINLAREAGDDSAVDRYAKNALSVGNTLKDKILLSSSLLRYCAALHERGAIEKAQQYAQEALSHVDDLPLTLVFGVYTHAARPLASSGDKKAKKLLEKAYQIARSGFVDDDPGCIRPSTAFAQMWIAHAHIESKEYSSALEILESLNENSKYTRRLCIIRTLQARALLGNGEYEQATIIAQSALDIAQCIKSKPNMKALGIVYQHLQNSPVSKSLDVMRLGMGLRQI